MSDERSLEHSSGTGSNRDDNSDEMSIHSETRDITETLERSKIQGKMKNEFIK